MIADYLELIYVCKYQKNDVYISRRSIKHFVESRKSELLNKHDNTYILKRLFIIIDNIYDILNNNDEYELLNNRHYFSKRFGTIDISKIRVVLELKGEHYEIVTMHYQKLKTSLIG